MLAFADLARDVMFDCGKQDDATCMAANRSRQGGCGSKGTDAKRQVVCICLGLPTGQDGVLPTAPSCPACSSCIQAIARGGRRHLSRSRSGSRELRRSEVMLLEGTVSRHTAQQPTKAQNLLKAIARQGKSRCELT